ncbi:hypothetical protein Tco_1325737 [Tanacetum coccineum]
MATSSIVISFDSSDEKKSTIAPVISSAAHVDETTLVALPTRLCGLVPYSGSDSDSPDEDLYVATIAHWRSGVTARPSSSSEFPIAPVTAPLGIRRRKRVGPLPARRLACRHASPHSSDHHSSSSSLSSNSSPVHSSGLDASDQAHSGSSTRDVSPSLCDPPRRAPRLEDMRHYCLDGVNSIIYYDPPTTSGLNSLIRK